LGLSTLLAGAKRGSESEIKHLLEMYVPVNDIHANNSKLVDYIESLHKCINFKYLNHLFIEPNTQPQNEFTETLNKNYKFSTVSSLNFEDKANATHVINEWVEKSVGTEFKRKIVEAVINSDAKMILVNALHFKANWFKKFDKNLTKPEDFHCMDGSVVQVDMMRLSSRKFKFKSNAAGIDASICEFPFLNQELSMSIILPSQDSSLAIVESQCMY
jgi:serpin B